MQISASNQNSLTKKVFSHSFFNVIASIISSFSRLGLIVFLTRFYSTEEFGLWASITAFSAILIVSDFGISNILRNKLSAYIAGEANRDNEAKYLFSNVFFFFFVLTAILLLIIFVWHYFFPLDSLFNTKDLHLKEMGVYTLLIIQVISFISIPFGFAGVCMFSYHETKWFSVLNSLIILLSVIIVCICAYHKISILYIGIIYFSFPTLINIYSTVFFLKRRKWKLIPDFKNIIPFNLKIIYQGFNFFVVQILSAFIFNSATLIVSSNIGLTEASEFNLVQKLFVFAVAIYQSAFNPVWAGYSNAIHSKNWDWCHKMYTRSIGITLSIFTILIIFITFFGNTFLTLLGGDKYVSDSFIFIYVGIGMLFYVLWCCAITIHSAAGRMKVIAFSLVIAAGLLLIFPRQNLFSISVNSISLFIAILYFSLSIFAILEGYFFIKRKINNEIGMK